MSFNNGGVHEKRRAKVWANLQPNAFSSRYWVIELLLPRMLDFCLLNCSTRGNAPIVCLNPLPPSDEIWFLTYYCSLVAADLVPRFLRAAVEFLLAVWLSSNVMSFGVARSFLVIACSFMDGCTEVAGCVYWQSIVAETDCLPSLTRGSPTETAASCCY